MNKERAREILKDFSQQLNDRKVMLPTNSEIYKDNEDLLQALDIAIESLAILTKPIRTKRKE